MKKTTTFISNLAHIRSIFAIIGIFLFISFSQSCKKDSEPDIEDPIDTTETITFSMDDFIGTWHRHSIITSSDGSGYWIYGTAQNTDAQSVVNLVLPNGTWDTTFVGETYTISNTGLVTISNDPASYSWLNSSKTLTVGTTKREDSYTLVFDQKVVAGTSYSIADFEGIWHNHYLAAGGSWSGWVHSISTIDNSGGYTVSNVVKSDGTTNVGTGVFAISSGGIITIDGMDTYHGFMSGDKTLTICNMTDGGGGGGIAISQKQVSGTTFSIADLEGEWFVNTIITGSENWTEHGLLTVNASGAGELSDMVRADGNTFNNPGTLNFSITSSGVVTFGEDFHGYLSSDKTLLIGTRSDGSTSYSLTVFQKLP